MSEVVENGVVRKFSVSQARTFLSCPRQWHFYEVQKREKRKTKSAAKGDEGHARIETYLKTGKDVLGKFERAGLHFMPTPGPDLLVEEWFGTTPLVYEGVPFRGKIDLISARNLHTGTLELTDWKFSREPRKWAAKAEDLISASTEAGIQTMGYGQWALNARERFGWRFDRIKVTHGNFAFEGRPDAFPVDATITVDKVESESVKINSLVREVKDVAREPDWHKVPATTDEKVCTRKYGGCPFYAECKGAASLIAKAKSTKAKVDNAMGFLSSIAKGPTTKTETPAAPVAEPPAAPPTKKLLIEDQSTQSDAALIAQQAVNTIPCSPALKQRFVYRLPDGTEGMFLCMTEIGGVKKYSFVADKPGAVPVLLAEGTPVVSLRDAGPNPEPPMVLPPDAPKSDPKLAARVDPVAEAVQAPAPVAPPAEAPAKRARRTKAEMEAARVAVEQAYGVTTCDPLQASPARTRVFVNCIVPGIAGQSILPWLEGLCDQILKGVGCDVPDIRLAHGDAIGFGKWQGALAAAARQSPPPPGDYLVTETDDRVRAVLPELSKLCAPGDFVVGR